MRLTPLAITVLVTFASLTRILSAAPADDLKKTGINQGVVALVGQSADYVVDFAKAGKVIVYFQSADAAQVAAVRQAAEKAGLLGTRIFVDAGDLKSLQLANNIADAVLVAPSAADDVTETELLRILRPRATAVIGSRRIVKPVPKGIDEWSHPFHGPDNNPQSTDQLAKGDFQTQFLAVPKFSPMPEQTVIAGGRIYKAMGHIAHKENQNEWLNTLVCINAYNGTILWKRPLPAGFMIHRNTMIATQDALLLGDFDSCKIIDGLTGKTRDELKIPKGLGDGPVWKWMALRNGTLFALIGAQETKVAVQKSNRRGLGHWPWGMWQGHDYKNPATSFGFGRTLVAYDLQSKKQLWATTGKDYIDARALCMSGDRLFTYYPEKYLAAVDIANGKELWRNADKDLLAAIGPNQRAQHYITGYATTCYAKSTEDYIFFAGPQRARLVAASANDGKLLWTHKVGNLQLVLRKDAVYAAGPQGSDGVKLDYPTGKTLASFPARRACTRATGCVDSIFYRASGGTVRVMTETNTAQHISPMRPPCQDGVLVSNGYLYWGPWMCGCQLSLYGHIGLGAVTPEKRETVTSLTVGDNLAKVQPFDIQQGDWVSYRGDNARSDATTVAIPTNVELAWKTEITNSEMPTAPVAAGGLVFIADRTGTVRALDSAGKLVWQAYTGGAIYYPPAIADGRVFVGSADGRVYAYEARTGRFLWSHRLGPQADRIPVYGRLISRWPVAGGVVVQDKKVYAAAGIAHYDGTYVAALDAVTGKIEVQNTTSGTLSKQVNSGVSMQGNLTITDGELRFLAGGVYETARYDLKTLECKNQPKAQVNSQYRTAFYPLYPSYGKFVSLEHTCADGSTLCHDASYEGSLFDNLALQAALPPGVPRDKKEASRWRRRGRKVPGPKDVWKDVTNRRFTSFVVSKKTLLSTGHPDAAPKKPFLAALDIKTGKTLWEQALPSEAVKGGTAMDAAGRIYVALENGQLLCYQAKAE
jgi:outer membrane protein assembly factor BamB